MKLTMLFLLFFTFHIHASGFGQQRINLRVKKTELAEVLRSIEEKTSYRFLYNNELPALRSKVTLNAKAATIEEVLPVLLFYTDMTFHEMANNLIVIKPDPLVKKDISVTGTVTDSSGAPLSGVSVQVKGSTIGTATNAEGNFTLAVPEANSILVFSAVGYEEQEYPLNGSTHITLSLKASQQVMDQVVVIGYGTASKRDLTGSIARVDAKEIADRPSANPLNLLQGKVSGVSVVTSGRPGSEPDIRIRGTNSINGVKPVYIVDGILNDNINFLNPADIESIEVLKDGSSLAIFGVRGANGAIAITTKKAKAGQLLVNFNTSFGIKDVQRRIKVTDGPTFLTLYQEQMANMGTSYSNPAYTANTDWQDVIFQKAKINYDNISITSGTEKNKFYLGLGYMTEEGVIKNEAYKKYTINFSDELKVSKNLKFGANFSGYYAEPTFGRDVASAVIAAPIAPVYAPDGSGLLHSLPSFQRAQVNNPLVSIDLLNGTRINKEYRVVGSVFGELNFLKNFTFRTQLFADYGFNSGRGYSPIITVYNPDIAGASKIDSLVRKTSVNQSQNRYPKTQMDYLLTYKKKIDKHDLTVLGGITTYYSGYEGVSSSLQQGTASIIPNDPRFWYVDAVGDQATKQGSGSAWEDASISYLGRVLYNFDRKYLVNASFRRDGSSQFYKIGNQWKNFGAVGLAWVASNEDFLKGVSDISNLKIKGSWAVLGSKNIPEAYRYPAYPVLTNAEAGVFGENVVNALQPSYMTSNDLNWETVRTTEAGFELGLFRNKLNFEVVYYSKKTEDVITLVNQGAGLLPLLANLGTIQNSGFEFSSSWNKQIGEDITLSLNANFTTVKNKVLKLNLEGFDIINGPARTTAGYPIGYFYGYQHDGIYQSFADILASPNSTIGAVQPGDIKYKDVDGDGAITTKDRTIIGNPTPDFTYGGGANLSYKGLDFGVDFQGVYGNEIYRTWNQGTFADFNYQVNRVDRWRGAGTSNWEPILHSGRANNYQNSSYWIEDGSFFRIRNVQLGYRFHTDLLSRIRVKSLRVYLNAQNLATFANNTGYTPEIGGSATSFGVDNGTYPVPAIYTIGLNLNF
ncbi:SusC/RagA family TonB-linked outer membrane protein [Niabella drilacis]|uniref:TonB-linked outer membrane protein, SusC/RagA family n=1 Tax=Niabella drilacis (strain DSM 25811 / CCM 8410 / CCUG 62505 / LMG 26954 / E90) TaxID=1285928 RepID=A0A1G7B9T9_NIADE|nr:TonB-dependent receptor [Niabella drilacis]SDE23888.1 TonB-linked outer membrane protein, SusC/RagA family [Niabella drilacis]